MIVKRLAGAVKHADVVARQAGDEFLVLLRDLPGEQAAARERVEAIAERLRARVRETIVIDGIEAHVGVSVGGALFPFDAAHAEGLLEAADARMYERKLAQRGQQRTLAPREELEMIARLRRGLERGEFVLHYQPILGAGERVSYHEALVRWQDPERGLLYPGAFIDAAERTGMIVELGEWVLAEAIRQAGVWQARGLPAGVSVNVSARQLADPGLPGRVRGLLAAAGVDASGLLVELTESQWLHGGEELRVLDELRDVGIGLAIDDFGTGHASLSRLRDLRATTMKIDRAFVMHVTEDPADAQALACLIGLGAAYGLTVVVEGIETEPQANVIGEIGLPVLRQGFLYGKPAPPA